MSRARTVGAPGILRGRAALRWRVRLAGMALVVALGLCPQPSSAAPDMPVDIADGSAEAEAARTRSSAIRALVLQIQSAEAELSQLREASSESDELEGRRQLEGQQSSVEAELRRLRGRLTFVLTGVELGLLDEPPSREIRWEDEAEQLLAPLLYELREATATAREVEWLRVQIAHVEQQLPQAQAAVRGLERELTVQDDPGVVAELASLLGLWSVHAARLESELEVARTELAQVEASREGVIGSSREFVSVFFRTRGLNMLLALGAFVLVFAAVRLCWALGRRVLRRRRPTVDGLAVRLIDLFFYAAALGGGSAAALGVLYASGDWTLLVLAFALLAALAWSARVAIPKAWTELRLLLNLGAVRHGERLVWKGVPWQLTSLRPLSELANPALPGAVLRLPLSVLATLESRPCVEGEPWFPSRAGDWVRLPSDEPGEVLHQGPDFVEIATPSGHRTFRTADYLAAEVTNLSRGWSVELTVELDRRHRDVVGSLIPERVAGRLQERLDGAADAAAEEVRAWYGGVAAAGLELRVEVLFGGASAPHWEQLEGAVHAWVLESLNEGGWELASPRFTLVSGAPSGPPRA